MPVGPEPSFAVLSYQSPSLLKMDQPLTSQLSQYIATHILKQPSRSISIAEPLISSGLIDSFSLVDLALFIEDTYGVHIDDTELNKDAFDTLEQLSALIMARRA
jgi:acyl carrier protein